MSQNKNLHLIKWTLTTLAVVLAVLVFVLWIFTQRSPDNLETQSQVDWLSVTPQDARDIVRIARVDMQNAGWVVARGVEGDRLGQVIEISPYLSAGIHSDVEITLGEFYNGEELVVMIYEDNIDKVFNDLDVPTLDKNGRMIARYIETGEAIPLAMAESGAGSVSHMMPGVEMIQIRYTNDGFIPKNVSLKAGSMVEFVNESDREMWVASDLHPTHERLPTFDQFRPSPKGGVYRYVFDKVGTWPYHDHMSPSDDGVIMVE